jgi:glycerol-1-phosphatase
VTARTLGTGLLGSAEPLADRHDLAIVDLDGVVYVGADPVPGAAPALAAAHSRGMRLCYLTNNASRPAAEVTAHLAALGLPVEEGQVLTSAQVAATYLARTRPAGTGVLVVGGAGLREALREVGLVPVTGSQAEARGEAQAGAQPGTRGEVQVEAQAVVQGFHPDLSWRDLARGTHAVRRGLPWVATNLDRTVPTPDGPAPGNGTLVDVIATAAGRRPDAVTGKPQPEPFLEAARRGGSNNPLVIGDRLDTDLEGARAAGMAGLLVFTGVSAAGEVLDCPEHRRPHYLGRDLGALGVAHPEVTCVPGPGDGDGCTARCRAAEVRADATGLAVIASGADPLDLLRAACVAAWSWADAHPAGGGAGTGSPGGTAGRNRYAAVLSTLQRMDPGLVRER